MYSLKLRCRRASNDERGEGVISLAIGVLIMALLGAAMWVTFNQVVTDTNNKVTDQVNTIGG